jgi:hypothetical protein
MRFRKKNQLKNNKKNSRHKIMITPWKINQYILRKPIPIKYNIEK